MENISISRSCINVAARPITLIFTAITPQVRAIIGFDLISRLFTTKNAARAIHSRDIKPISHGTLKLPPKK